MEAANPTVTLDQGEDGLLGRDRSVGAVFGLPADEGFIRFQRLAFPAQLASLRPSEFFHALADAMRQESCGCHAAADGPVGLLRAHALLGRADQMNDLQPDPQRLMAGLEDGPHSDGERLAACIALVQAGPRRLALQVADAISLAAMLSDRPIRPQVHLDEFEGDRFIVEARLGKDERHGRDSLAPNLAGYSGYANSDIAQAIQGQHVIGGVFGGFQRGHQDEPVGRCQRVLRQLATVLLCLAAGLAAAPSRT